MTRAASGIPLDALAIILDRPILFAMNDPTKLTVEDWIATLEISEAQVAAGQSVPLEPILKRLHKSADDLEAQAKGASRRRVAAPSRR